MQTISLHQLIQQELQARQAAVNELDSRKQRIQDLIAEHCEVSRKAYVSREAFQDFCYQQLFEKDCHTSIDFSTYLNQIMPELGYPLGTAHGKLRVYRGLTWKSK